MRGLGNNELKFTVTEDHIKLLKRAYVGWDDCEFGAPEIDPKRPYGNSSVFSDISEILGIQPNSEGDFTSDQEDYIMKTHRELQTVLQIFLQYGRLVAGTFTRESQYSSLPDGVWKLELKQERKIKINEINKNANE